MSHDDQDLPASDDAETTLEVPAVTLRGLRYSWLPALSPQWPLPDTL